MDVMKKAFLMRVYESYWDMLPPVHLKVENRSDVYRCGTRRDEEKITS